jgi:hypothetical protein
MYIGALEKFFLIEIRSCLPKSMTSRAEHLASRQVAFTYKEYDNENPALIIFFACGSRSSVAQ